MSLQTITGQTITEPVTLAALKSRIKLTSTADDAGLVMLITAAREFAERISNRCLAARQFIEYRDEFPYSPAKELQIPRPPLVSVDKVEYLSTDYQTWLTWSASEYWVASYNLPAYLRPRDGFTYPQTVNGGSCVRVTFTAGADAIEQHWQLNIMDIAVFMYENAGAVVPTSLVTIPRIHYF
jgi:uncharacterized phiE125 gp8 family phage protein